MCKTRAGFYVCRCHVYENNDIFPKNVCKYANGPLQLVRNNTLHAYTHTVEKRINKLNKWQYFTVNNLQNCWQQSQPHWQLLIPPNPNPNWHHTAITACVVATSCCISDEPCQWEKAVGYCCLYCLLDLNWKTVSSNSRHIIHRMTSPSFSSCVLTLILCLCLPSCMYMSVCVCDCLSVCVG